MSDTATRINTVDLETRVYNMTELKPLRDGNRVCNARIKVACKFEDEWPCVWYELTAWGDAADTLAECGHGDDVIIRGGRLKTKAYRTKDGEIRVEGAIHTGNLERVGSLDDRRPAPKPQRDEDVPF